MPRVAGLDYLELRFGPATHADDEHGLTEVIAAVVGGMREGSADHRHAERRRRRGAPASRRADQPRRGPCRGRCGGRRRGRLRPGRRRAAVPGAATRTRPPSRSRARPGSASPATPPRPALLPPRARRSSCSGRSRIGHGAHIADDPGGARVVRRPRRRDRGVPDLELVHRSDRRAWPTTPRRGSAMRVYPSCSATTTPCRPAPTSRPSALCSRTCSAGRPISSPRWIAPASRPRSSTRPPGELLRGRLAA